MPTLRSGEADRGVSERDYPPSRATVIAREIIFKLDEMDRQATDAMEHRQQLTGMEKYPFSVWYTIKDWVEIFLIFIIPMAVTILIHWLISHGN